ncbi:MAG TPA: reactive intermediate/imine deaminase [Candidatus Hydrogenedentes bacterium]|nr:reactive intermediate/imine deaminase [Candidatus Hydrogenedentota bacterium]
MEKRCFFAENAPPAAGPYSHAVAAGTLLFVSGQAALAPDGSGPQKGRFEDEARLTLSNLRAILEDCGSGLEHVVKMTVFLADMDDFGKLNDIYKEFFPVECPARTCIQAARLPLDFQIEVEAIAILP